MGATRSFFRTLAKGPKQLLGFGIYADAHDFDSQTSSLEEVSFSVHTSDNSSNILMEWDALPCIFF
jgi:hypothetical protein